MSFLTDDRVSDTWKTIRTAIEAGLESDKTRISELITFESGTGDLGTFVRYEPAMPVEDIEKSAHGQAKGTARPMQAVLENVYELSFTTGFKRGDILAAQRKLSAEVSKHLRNWGAELRQYERIWILTQLLRHCVESGKLTEEDQIFGGEASVAALRVITFGTADATNLNKWSLWPTVSIAKGDAIATEPGLRAMVMPITGGPRAIRVEDFDLSYVLNNYKLTVTATARYQLAGLPAQDDSTWKRYTEVAIGEPPNSSAEATNNGNLTTETASTPTTAADAPDS